MQRLLIVGCGDVARRALPLLTPRYAVFALLRDGTQAAWWREHGAMPLPGDLDKRASLGRLAGLAHAVLHLAPPPNQGRFDTRTRNLLAALPSRSGRGQSLPRHLVYVSTTGVYGDCGGARMDETRPRRPETERARRRVDAEQQLRRFGAGEDCRVSILRAPGIYGADRLPLERLQKGTPALVADEDVYTNHIHADDLAAACVRALVRGDANRSYNVVDDSHLKMGEYFDQVAAAFGLPPAPRLSRDALARQLSPLQLSFVSESRRIGNRRLKEELGLRLTYPTVASGIEAARCQLRSASCS